MPVPSHVKQRRRQVAYTAKCIPVDQTVRGTLAAEVARLLAIVALHRRYAAGHIREADRTYNVIDKGASRFVANSHIRKARRYLADLRQVNTDTP